MPVLRTYRVRVARDRVHDYEEFERAEGVPMVTAMAGCLRAGFGRVREAPEPTYVFFSVWTDGKALEVARGSPGWRRVVDRLRAAQFEVEEGAAEHVDLVHLQEGAGHMRRPL